MTVPGNIWLDAWSQARSMPARKQKRLFDDTKEAENVIYHTYMHGSNLNFKIYENDSEFSLFSKNFSCFSSEIHQKFYITITIIQQLMSLLFLINSLPTRAHRNQQLNNLINSIDQSQVFSWLSALSLGQIVDQMLPVLFYSAIFTSYCETVRLELDDYLAHTYEVLIDKIIKISRNNESKKYQVN